MKRVLIISPYFPPSNAADMQRIRTSLPYFQKFGWNAEVVTVNPRYSGMIKDPLLTETIPFGVQIHTVEALNKKWTSKLGLGSLGLRSIWFYRNKVNELLKTAHYDLIYFSTTEFVLCVLGAYWKKKFNIPYVIDMQDPWHSEEYLKKPKSERPPKYWLIYRLHKYAERFAMRQTDGLVSVSARYIGDLKKRYPEINNIPAATITFGAFMPDLKIAEKNKENFLELLSPKFVNIVYIGRSGTDMSQALSLVFQAFRQGLGDEPGIFKKLRMYFIGTSYAPRGRGKPSVAPLAKKFKVDTHVIEISDRIGYYHTLSTLQKADALMLPGSSDPKYSASKLYPYLLTKKPLMAIFNQESNVVSMINSCTENVSLFTFSENSNPPSTKIYNQLREWAIGRFREVTLLNSFEKYSAENLTSLQVQLFESVISETK